MAVGNICKTTRRHIPVAATFSNILTAHSLLRLYMGRNSSAGTATNYELERVSIQGGGRDFSHLPRLEMWPIHHIGKCVPGLFPDGKLFRKWR